jgi:hypothetical protein
VVVDSSKQMRTIRIARHPQGIDRICLVVVRLEARWSSRKRYWFRRA